MESKVEMDKQEMMKKYEFLGRIMIVFYVINLLSVIASMVSVMGSYSQVSFSSLSWLRKTIIFCNALNIVVTAAFCACLFVAGRYVKAFRTSAILMVWYVILSIVDNFLKNPWALILMLAGMVIAIFQMKFLVDGLKDVLKGVDEGLSKGWSTFWKIYMIIFAATVIHGILYMILDSLRISNNLLYEDLLNDLLCVWMFVSVMIGIWFVMLLRKTFGSIVKYANAMKAGKSVTPEDGEAAKWQDVKRMLYVVGWMILFMIFSMGMLHIYNQSAGKQGAQNYESIWVVSSLCRYVMPTAAVMIGLALATLTRRHPFFLVAGILCVMGHGIEFLKMTYFSALESVIHSPVYLEIFMILAASICEILQAVFLAIAISSCVKKNQKALARTWLGIPVIYGIVIACVAMAPQILYQKRMYEKNAFFEKWCSLGNKYGPLYNSMALGSRVANVAVILLYILMLALLIVTMMVPKKIEKARGRRNV